VAGGNPEERRYRLVRSYELVFIVHPEVTGDDLTAVVDSVKNLVGRSKGEVVRVDSWGLRRLAYPIRKQWEGQYVLMQLEMAPGGVSELERGLKLAEHVMRHLVVRVEEQQEEPVEEFE
jgi:small subunit ribosomal protein S6